MRLERTGSVRIRHLLEKKDIGVWGEATVKRSLAKLRKLKLICNSSHRPRGYFLEPTVFCNVRLRGEIETGFRAIRFRLLDELKQEVTRQDYVEA